jgi:hypothetical protein
MRFKMGDVVCNGGITFKSGRRGFAVYRDGKVVAQYTAMGRQE